MAKESITTQSGREYKPWKGAGGFLGFGMGTPAYTNSLGYKFPEHDMTKATFSHEDITNLVTETNKKGRPLNHSEITAIAAPNGTRVKEKIDYYHYLLDQNAEKFGFDSSVYNDPNFKAGNNGEIKNDAFKDALSDLEEGQYLSLTNGPKSDSTDGEVDFYAATRRQEESIEDTLMTDPYGARATQYKQDMYGAIDEYEQSTNATLAAAELDAYKMLGQQQLQLENQIAQQRMQALKAGTTSAQLASQQLQNMFSAQAGASQIAQQTMANRAQNQNTFSQARMGVTGDLYGMLNSNQQAYGNIMAQMNATQGSYASYVNQSFAQMKANIQGYNQLGPDNYAKVHGLK